MISQIFKRSLVDFAFVCLFTKIAFHVWLLPANHFRVGVFFSLVQNDKRILGIYLLECVRRWIDGINEKSQIPLENEPAKTWHNFCMWYINTVCGDHRNSFTTDGFFFAFFTVFFFVSFLLYFWINSTKLGVDMRAAQMLVLWQGVGHFFASFFLSLSHSYVGIRAFCYSMPILIFIWDLSRLNNANAHSVVHNRIDVWMFFFLFYDRQLDVCIRWQKESEMETYTADWPIFYSFSSFCWQNGIAQTEKNIYNLFKFIFAWNQMEEPYWVCTYDGGMTRKIARMRKKCLPNEIHLKINYNEQMRIKNCTWN